MIATLYGDCRAVLAELPAASVQTVVTSPPYWGLRSYLPDGHQDKHLEIGSEPLPDCLAWARGEPPCDGCYVCALRAVFAAVWRALRDDGTLWINLGDAYANDRKWGGQTSGKHAAGLHGTTGIGRNRHKTGLPSKSLIGLPWRAALSLQADGWTLRSEIIWHKPNVMPESVDDRPTRAHEHLFLLSKAPRYYYDSDAIREPYNEASIGRYAYPLQGTAPTARQPGGDLERRKREQDIRDPNPRGRNTRSVWTITPQRYPGAHFATFPEALAERCILAGSAPRACEHCGAPWERQIEATGHKNKREPAHVPGNCATKTDSTGWAPTRRATDTWAPGCDCAGSGGRGACVVLDPFAGTGTVLRVTERLGRSSIGIELNQDGYGPLIEQRTDKIQLMMPELI